MPKFVVPAVATTANTRRPLCRCSASISLPTVSPCNLPCSSTAIFKTSTSITCAADAIDECACSLQAITQRVVSGKCLRACARATTNADRLPIVPPCTKTPPELCGKPAKSAIQRSAWFSAKTAPEPSCHEPPYRALAPTTKSKRFAYSLGADGMKAKLRG